MFLDLFKILPCLC